MPTSESIKTGSLSHSLNLLLGTFVVLLLGGAMFPESGMANSPVLTEKVGPGVVGETHSMTYDPADISGGTIYVGGRQLRSVQNHERRMDTGNSSMRALYGPKSHTHPMLTICLSSDRKVDSLSNIREFMLPPRGGVLPTENSGIMGTIDRKLDIYNHSHCSHTHFPTQDPLQQLGV